MEGHDPDALTAIIEEINEKVEKEHLHEKRVLLKNFLISSLKDPTLQSNFDERRYFLDTLDGMTLMECEMVSLFYQQPQPLKIGSISYSGTDQYAVVGAINRIKSYGFVQSSQGSFSIGGGGDNTLNEMIRISPFGKKFCEFCLV